MTAEQQPDIDQVRRLFEQLSVITAGNKTVDAMAAVQDFYCAMICVAADDRDHALELANELHRDVIATVSNNYDHYTGEGSSSPIQPPPAGRQ